MHILSELIAANARLPYVLYIHTVPVSAGNKMNSKKCQ